MATIHDLVEKHRPDLSPYQALYKHFHANPELSNQEHETAATIAKHLSSTLPPAFDVRTGIGGTGIAALLSNGSGPTVLLRADFDALPVEEKTGLPYASTKRMRDADGVEKPVMHACGHDMHITSLLAAAELLVAARESWAGTLVLVFQPAEERGTGAQGTSSSPSLSPMYTRQDPRLTLSVLMVQPWSTTASTPPTASRTRTSCSARTSCRTARA